MGIINVLESIKREKLVFYKDHFTSTFNSFSFNYLLIFPFAAFVIIIMQSLSTISSKIIYIILVLVLIMVWFYFFINTRRLKKLKCKPKHSNKFDVQKYIEKNNWNIIIKKNDFIKASLQKKYSGIYLNRIVFIFFNKNEILINCSTTNSVGIVTPIHWFGNREIENNFIKEFTINEK